MMGNTFVKNPRITARYPPFDMPYSVAKTPRTRRNVGNESYFVNMKYDDANAVAYNSAALKACLLSKSCSPMRCTRNNVSIAKKATVVVMKRTIRLGASVAIARRARF